MKLQILQFNSEKTEILHCAVDRIPPKLPLEFWPTSPATPLAPSSVVHNLGVMVDNKLTLENCQQNSWKWFYSDQSISENPSDVLLQNRAMIVRSTILSKLDYCDALLLESPQYLIERLHGGQTGTSATTPLLRLPGTLRFTLAASLAEDTI